MRIFAGLSKTDYEEVFRAIGALIDERGWNDINLTEVDEGLILQVATKGSYKETKPRLETYLLTDSDVERLMREAVLRRQHLTARVLATPPDPAIAETPARGEEPAAPPAHPARPTWGAEPVDWRANSDDLPLPRFDEQDGASATLDATPPAVGFEGNPEELEPLPANFGLAPFDPTPFSLAAPPAPTKDKVDPGVARAAVVMAHIVAARLKSGIPMTGDDPDLASLLEQVQALDEAGIGKG